MSNPDGRIRNLGNKKNKESSRKRKRKSSLNLHSRKGMSRGARGRLETALFLNSSRTEGNEMWMLPPGAQPSLDMGPVLPDCPFLRRIRRIFNEGRIRIRRIQ